MADDALHGRNALAYFPLLGEVEPFPKYLRNVAMLAIVLTAGAIALPVGGSRDNSTTTKERAL